jgi:hypothetical protein
MRARREGICAARSSYRSGAKAPVPVPTAPPAPLSVVGRPTECAAEGMAQSPIVHMPAGRRWFSGPLSLPRFQWSGGAVSPLPCNISPKWLRTDPPCGRKAARVLFVSEGQAIHAHSTRPRPVPIRSRAGARRVTARTSTPAVRTTATAGRSGRYRAGPENATWIRIKQHAAPGCFRCIGVSPLVHGVAGVWLRLASMHLWGFCCVLSSRVR